MGQPERDLILGFCLLCLLIAMGLGFGVLNLMWLRRLDRLRARRWTGEHGQGHDGRGPGVDEQDQKSHP